VGAGFVGVGVGGAAAGAKLSAHVSEPVLLAAFAVLMLMPGGPEDGGTLDVARVLDHVPDQLIPELVIEEVDLVVTPLPTPDDWHRFELALRKVRGVGQLRTEYYRHGVLKVRVSYQGGDRLAAALRAGVPGYRVRVIGEDRATLQILVTSEGDERRPG